MVEEIKNEKLELAVDMLTKAQPIDVPSKILSEVDIVEEMANTPLGRNNHKDDPRIVVTALITSNINPLSYSALAQKLYTAAGEPQYEGDLLKRKEENSRWGKFIDKGRELASASLSLARLKGKELNEREAAIAGRYQYSFNTSLTITENDSEKYPPELVVLARENRELVKQVDEGEESQRAFLENKLKVEKMYLEYLLSEYKDK